jgi:hypothetical protein
MAEESEVERAARKSRLWKERQREIAQARAEDAELARKQRAQIAEFKRSQYHDRGWAGPAFVIALACVVLVLWEKSQIEERAARCLGGPSHPKQENCAATISKSAWSWLLSDEIAEELKAARSLTR